MTSGNMSGQPQAISNAQARQQLQGIADLLVLHDREIINRLDDSVVRQTELGLQTLRRARGYAPVPLPLPPGFEQAPDLLALGGELKNSLCLLQSGRAILSQYLGDLEDAATYESWEQTIDLYRQLYQHHPQALVRDMHPEYLSANMRWPSRSRAQRYLRFSTTTPISLPAWASMVTRCMALRVLGICLDGTGYGDDGQLWGGELLRVDYRRSQRLGHLTPAQLIGGSQAIREPWRNLFAQLSDQLDDAQWTTFWPALADKPLPVLRAMLQKQLNCPNSSSAGRLFDAVAAALGCCAERDQLRGGSGDCTGKPGAPVGTSD